MAQYLFRRAALSLILACVILGGLMWGQAHQPVAGDKPTAVGSPAWHMDRCEPAPAGTLPSRVVMFPKGKGFVISTADARLLHEALEQALNSKPYGHTIVGFCQ